MTNMRWLTIYLFALASAINPALAALTVNQLSGFNAVQTEAAPPPSASVTFNGCTSDSSDLSTYTFSSVSVGDAASDRLILVGSTAEDSSNTIVHPTFTIGGVNAVEAATTNGAYTVHTGFAIAAVPTGTTADIVLTYAEVLTSAGICSWSLYGFSSAAFSASGRGTLDTGASFDINVAVTAGDLVAAMSTDTGTTETISADASLFTVGWTSSVASSSHTRAYGYAFPIPSTGSMTITTDWTGTNDVHTHVVVITP
jgi:hypothetical protein